MAVATEPSPQDAAANAARAERRERRFARVAKVTKTLDMIGLSFLSPLLRLLFGDSFKQNGRDLWRLLGAPVLAIALFIAVWDWAAPKVETSLGTIPGPAQVWNAAEILHQDYLADLEAEEAFYERQEVRNQRAIDAGRPDRVRDREYRSNKVVFYDQIWTSLQTVFTGFLLGTLIAVPLGVLCGLSPTINSALNPIIQVAKPISPLAWLPIVTLIVSAYVVSDDPSLKPYLISAIVVTLCSLWPTLINTALGVASIDKDLVNVGKVLKLSTRKKVFRLILPSALPLIFTGMRLSLGVGWMVLIAAEMLSQNPGLGKFVWDEYQNNSNLSLAKIMVAVLTIGVIGLLLDRIMYALQAAFTYSSKR